MASSANIASKLGEPYIFVCRAGFIKIAVSLIIKGQVVGCFMAGPVVMARMSESIIANIFNLNTISPEMYSKIIIFIRNMKVFTPKEIAYTATIFFSCVLSSIARNWDYAKINNQHKEQAKIGEELQNFKKQNEYQWTPYPYNTEKELIQKVKSGDSKGAQATMQALLNEVLLIEAGNLELVKTRMLELCAILSRAAADGGFFPGINTEYMNSLSKVESVHDLRLWTSELISHLSQNILNCLYSGNSQIVSQVVQYVNTNYMNDISLKQIANLLHTNPSYLSMLFKQEMGITFTDYLNDVRIKRSKELLTTTNLSLLDISLQTGFEEQSYFTKVFKKITGYTPKEYRKMNQTNNKQTREYSINSLL